MSAVALRSAVVAAVRPLTFLLYIKYIQKRNLLESYRSCSQVVYKVDSICTNGGCHRHHISPRSPISDGLIAPTVGNVAEAPSGVSCFRVYLN